MSFATRHGKGNKFNVNTDGFEYRKLEDLYKEDPDAIWPIQGIYINGASLVDPFNQRIRVCEVPDIKYHTCTRPKKRSSRTPRRGQNKGLSRCAWCLY